MSFQRTNTRLPLDSIILPMECIRFVYGKDWNTHVILLPLHFDASECRLESAPYLPTNFHFPLRLSRGVEALRTAKPGSAHPIHQVLVKRRPHSQCEHPAVSADLLDLAQDCVFLSSVLCYKYENKLIDLN